MPIITNATLTAMDKGFNRLFEEGRAAANKMITWPKIARKSTSTGASEVHGWIDVVPHMRQWDSGSRVVMSVKEQAYEIDNLRFESTIGVEATDIKDDRLGMYRMLMQDLGEEGEIHLERAAYAALKLGRSTPISDGKSFFATDHPVYANVDQTGANTPTSNILNPTETAGEEWYLLHTMGMRRPVIYQEREALRLDSLIDYNDSRVLLLDQYIYGAYARRAWGFSRWQYAVSSRDELTHANYQAAYKMMLEFKRDGGDSWGLMPTLLVVTPGNRVKARDILIAERLADGASNTEMGTTDLSVSPWLTV